MRQKAGKKSTTKSTTKTRGKARIATKLKKGKIALAGGALRRCAGVDCTKLTIKLVTPARLVGVKPPLPAADIERGELEARLLFDDFLRDTLTSLAKNAAAGDAVSFVIQSLLDGLGGPQICAQFGENCRCQPDPTRERVETGMPIRIPITFDFKDRNYVAFFDLETQKVTLPGKCMVGQPV